jgi:hypothetical protein
MYWDYRFVNMPSDNDGEDWLALREVYYDVQTDKPVGHVDPCVGSETEDGIKRIATWIAAAAAKPVLHEDDFKKRSEEEMSCDAV